MAQTLEAIFYQGSQRRIDHTPSVAVACGEVVGFVAGARDLAGVCTTPGGIPAGTLGSLDVDGMYKFKKAQGVAFAQGDILEWDDVGNTTVGAAAAGTFHLGVAYQAALATDDYVLGWLNKASSVAA